MKRCPECRRDYYDDTLSFCLSDGTELVYGLVDEPATAMFGVPPSGGPSSESPTRAQSHTTDQTAIFSAGAEAEPRGSSGNLSERPSLSAHRAAKPLAVVGVAVVFLVAGFFGYRYFTASSKQIESIAVMPFVNESGNADVEYLSDGMTETLISSLSNIPNLSVKARGTVFFYKGKEITPKKIGEELGVQAVLLGRVAQRGDDLKLSLELVNTQTQDVMWSETYNRKQSDLVKLQSEIAKDVSAKLKTKLSGADEAKVTKTTAANPESYQLYLKGRFFAIKRTAKDARKAMEYYQQAIDIDPNYALAYSGLAEANWFIAIYSYPQLNDFSNKARDLALRAIELDSTLAEPHSLLGALISVADHDIKGWDRESKLAIELNPNYAEGHRRRGLFFRAVGRLEEARGSLRRALELDPLSPTANFNNAELLFMEGKYEESETLGKKNIELDPNFWYARKQLFDDYRWKKDYPSAVEELAKMQEIRGEPDAATLIRESFAKGGWDGFLRAMVAGRERAKLYPYFRATFYVELGDKDNAFATLNEALVEKDQHIVLYLKADPYMNPLRSDPRFKGLMKRMNLPE